MKHFRIVNRQLTPIEWEALRAALPYRNHNVPFVPGLLASIPESVEDYEVFALRGACTEEFDESFFVLLGWREEYGGEDDDAAPPSTPFAFAIYSDDRCEGILPTFDDLYVKGLRTRANSDAKFEGFFVGVMVSLVAVLVAIYAGIRPIPDARMATIYIMMAGSCAGLATWRVSYRRHLKRISS